MHTFRLAHVFPGQGSQSVGMLNAWRGNTVVEQTIAEAADAIDLDLWRLVEHGPLAELNETVNTQPIMVAASVALYRAWQQFNATPPQWAAGHSVGEISALTAAGAISLRDAMRLVRARARAMAKAVPDREGGMAAVLGLDDATVERLCRECAQGQVLEAVNYNAPGQVVVAGHTSAVERIKQPAKAAGAKMVFILPVSGPFHSTLMKPAADVLAAQLGAVEWRPPAFRVLHNSNLQEATAPGIRQALLDHLVRPVPWVQTVRRFADEGVTHLLETGPGEVLTNLAGRIAPQMRAMPLYSPQAMEAAAEALLAKA